LTSSSRYQEWLYFMKVDRHKQAMRDRRAGRCTDNSLLSYWVSQ